MSLDCEVVVTRSGAPAMRDRITGEVMHPVVGPKLEAERLYVKPSRLEARLLDDGWRTDAPLVVFDVGLGAGSNAAAAWHLSESLPVTARRLEIVSFDRSLAGLDLALHATHAEAFGLGGSAAMAGQQLLAGAAAETPRTRWRVHEGDFLDLVFSEPPASADVVFWDPFSPQSNPEMWTAAAFRDLRTRCREGATVHTYGGATSTRAALLLAGFFVGAGEEGGAGRRSTVAATRRESLACPLGGRWLERLRRSSAPFPADAPPDAMARVEGHPQFEGPATS